MYSRMLQPPSKSFFLFGPRGTGKTTFLKSHFTDALYIDLLEAEIFNDLLANPQRLENLIPSNFKKWVILDEVQRVPALLHEVHRLIERYHYTFILTGSSARKLKQKDVNLLAGRALSYRLYPLTAAELGKDFNLHFALQHGGLPAVWIEKDPRKFLESYVATYLREEVLQEGIVRNLGAFSRFLETASLSQGAVLNVSEVARECGVHRKVAENYFSILEDLLLAFRLPIFSKRAKRRLLSHDKFYFFDTGVYQTIRPRGPLDSEEEIVGAALETLVLQELRAINDYKNLGYSLYYWRTPLQHEVDFVLYGKRGFLAIEVKRSSRINERDLRGLQAFLREYPTAQGYLLYGGKRCLQKGSIQLIPVADFFADKSFF